MMENINLFINLVLIASIAYLGCRDRLYKEAFKALGIYNIPNLQREISSLKVLVSRLEEQVEDSSYKIHGMEHTLKVLNRQSHPNIDQA